MTLENANAAGEFLFKSEGASVGGKVPFKVSPNKVWSFVPAEIVEVISPSDRRIKKDIELVDTDHLLQRMQKIGVKKYRYTDEWKKVRGLKEEDVGVDEQVRGVIAQEVFENFPEYIHRTPMFSLPEKGFFREDFHEVNKIRMTIDTIGAFQAHHRRFEVGPNAPTSSGEIIVSTADAGSYRFFDAASKTSPDSTEGTSGNILMTTGSANQGASGSVSVRSGPSTGGRGGAISIAVGRGDSGQGG